MTFADAYHQKFPKSAALYERAKGLFPSGVNHDGKYMQPFPLSFSHGKGAIKWDVDGNEIIDFVMGHGALILGHSHPSLVEAVNSQILRGTHLAGNHRLELEWADLVCCMVPSAERVRFVQSGTEATMLALRIARAYTGRNRFIRFQGHFHGWHDYVLRGNRVPFDAVTSSGIPEVTLSTSITLPMHELTCVSEVLKSGDVAAIIVEPGGGTQGKIPADPEWIRALRRLTEQTGAILIFDEVVSGFRAAPGGVQELIGVIPDLTTLAKALAGGLPGGAVCGKADVMEVLSFQNRQKVAHPGTYNANPLAAASGIASLKCLQPGSEQSRAASLARKLRDGMNQVFLSHGIMGCVYGEDSTFHIHLGEDSQSPEGLLQGGAEAARELRARLLYHQVDLLGPHGWVSSAHDETHIDKTIEALDKVLAELVGKGAVA